MEVDDSNPSATAADSSSATAEADPVVASYKVYANPALAANRQMLILQHPNKQGPLNVPYAQISEVRVKPRSSMIEVDVPITQAPATYDRDKGQRWGSALSRSMAAKNGGSHGLAGGFGVGVSAMRSGKRRDDQEREDSLLDWGEAVRQDKVLRTQTLGGQLPAVSETECRYMVGVFRGKELHLTPASASIQLRPQLHHLDAIAEQERATRREGAAAAAGGGKDGAGASSAPARAIHMSIKSADSGGELTTETMADRLRNVQTEPWRRLTFEDENSNKSWDVFSDNLMYRAKKNKKKDGDEDEDGASSSKIGVSGKGKEREQQEVINIDSSSDSEQLRAQWDAESYLKAISAMKNGPEGSRLKEVDDVEVKKEEEEAEPSAALKTTSTTTAKGKGKASASTTAKKTANAKGKSVAFKGQAMEID